MSIARGPKGNTGDVGWLPDSDNLDPFPWITYIDNPALGPYLGAGGNYVVQTVYIDGYQGQLQPLTAYPAAVNGVSSGTNATVGTYTWAGTTATTSSLINEGVGGYTWAGTTATTSSLISANAGAYSWAGTTATTSELINAAVGAYSWAGTTSTASGLINQVVGTYSWAGTTSTFGGPINATAGAYTWSGTNSDVPTLINSDGGATAYTWAGTMATMGSGPTTVPAGHHRKRFGVRDGTRLLVFDTREAAEAARKALLKTPERISRIKVKPVETIELPAFKELAKAEGVSKQYDTLLAAHRYNDLVQLHARIALQEHQIRAERKAQEDREREAKARADREEEEIATILLHMLR